MFSLSMSILSIFKEGSGWWIKNLLILIFYFRPNVVSNEEVLTHLREKEKKEEKNWVQERSSKFEKNGERTKNTRRVCQKGV